jgi:hypothetical protein
MYRHIGRHLKTDTNTHQTHGKRKRDPRREKFTSTERRRQRDRGAEVHGQTQRGTCKIDRYACSSSFLPLPSPLFQEQIELDYAKLSIGVETAGGVMLNIIRYTSTFTLSTARARAHVLTKKSLDGCAHYKVGVVGCF